MLIAAPRPTELTASPKVALVLPDVLRHPTTDSSGEFMGLAQPGGAWQTGVTGRGVVVGVIDSGIWPEHPSFADHGLPRPPAGSRNIACNFGNKAHNTNDKKFTCNNKLIGARQMLETYRFFLGAEPDEFDRHATTTATVRTQPRRRPATPACRPGSAA